MIDVSSLNEDQKKAVLDDHKYIRVVAGAGSGKTRVLTMRIAHLIEDEHVPGRKILAITFTNKAANEMKERVRKLVPEDTSAPWISTIHSFCVRVLREDIAAMGWPRNFTVLDAEDQKAILKEAYKALETSAQDISYASALDYISNCKYGDITPERAADLANGYNGDEKKAKIYAFYVHRQEELYGLDFDDLILWVVRMFKQFSDIAAKWQRRFSYVLVDEFQDIDAKQYELIRQLTGPDNSLYVVGDPDQTIYTWRGADVNIILNFAKDFPNAVTIMLNQNYRSTSCILNGANSVIRNNRNRLKKELFTERQSDQKIIHHASTDDEMEAAYVASEIVRLHDAGKAYKDIAILYRSNYLSRSLEKGLLDARIPYIIYGGIRFYERQEVKDALCYMRMVTRGDDLAFRRIINVPRRGIGAKTIDRIEEEARRSGMTMYEVAASQQLFSGRTQKTLNEFTAMVEKWRKQETENSLEPAKLFQMIMEDTGYQKMLEEDHETDRIENLKELIDDIQEYTDNNPDSSLDEYLQVVSLYGDRDETLASDYVQMMTVHAAKGLEFDTVFVTDMNEGIFPNERALSDSSKGIEEERRLAYVAFTRARNRLYICEAGGFSFILQRVRTPSRFIKEIDDDYIIHEGAVDARLKSPWGNDDDDEDRQPQSFGGRHADTVHARPVYRIDNFTASGRNANLAKGDVVVHVKFGEGVVIKVQGGIATIAFAMPWGVKQIACAFPGLKRKEEVN